MCGIAGFVSLPNAPKFDARMVERFADVLAHRGPDGQGSYSNGACTFVHTRLAIIDIEGGHQPFVARRENGAEVALMANGEIYNNLELRQAMTDTAFTSLSDSEPPLYLYLKHGVDFVHKLRGMYAIAIWDGELERLILSRDPFGIKPLYYAQTEHGFAFASELRALVSKDLCAPKLNRHIRDELLQLQFSTGVDTAIEGIHRVAPGETLVIEKGVIVSRHQRAALPTGGPVSLSLEGALSRLDDVLNDTVGMHQRSDVPYGMFLSGGIDSSVLLAMMSRLNAEPVTAFTAGFSGTDVPDEREHARALARGVSARHIEVEFGEADFWAELPKIAFHMDDPAADYALLPTWKLAQTARNEGIKVVLTGEGGDELFGGYGRYRAARRWLFPKAMYRKGIMDDFGVLLDNDRARTWRAGIAQAGIAARTSGRTALQVAQAQDIATWLPGDLLTKMDRMLMAHGVEGRVPFLDPEMAAFAFALPDKLKIRHKLGKAVLRHWLARAMPAAHPYAKKRGFTVPVGEWIAFRGQRIGHMVGAQECIQAICAPDAIHNIFAMPVGRAGKAAWTLLFYALWHKIHIQGVAPDGDVFDVLSA
ncbi:asparagine synthase (glutamine-hydrolyzing) [Magnetovibrio blakemorei]|uniref:asparagine synthase (glutamine-hydrolyzing) n=1 Tax=Magnetovibrio blakemorei TaxID=28181 RepID=A0A1E5Q5I1_9PROT|nr:asparagine synthase (glutamine-hydrolyzing) [Magnetovibrio blakemorei]OEJ65695.1 asparagine synthase (glutamine-hydrolyzing) [Magnetovibrio blakemorei]